MADSAINSTIKTCRRLCDGPQKPAVVSRETLRAAAVEQVQHGREIVGRQLIHHLDSRRFPFLGGHGRSSRGQRHDDRDNAPWRRRIRHDILGDIALPRRTHGDRRRHFDSLEGDDSAGLAFLEHGEVGRSQAADRPPIFVEDRNIELDDVDTGTERRLRRRRGLLRVNQPDDRDRAGDEEECALTIPRFLGWCCASVVEERGECTCVILRFAALSACLSQEEGGGETGEELHFRAVERLAPRFARRT